MSANYTLNIDTGTVTANTQDLLNDVKGEWQSIFGVNLDTDASTPQGTLIQNETVARTSVMKNNADMANLMNPDQCYGIFLASQCAFLGQTPGTNTSTIGNGVNLVNSGTSAITIQAGNRVSTSAGDVFVISADITIPALTTGLGIIQSQSYGPIPLPVGALTIIDGVIGLGSAAVTSGTTITLGTLQLTDAQQKTKRSKTLFRMGLGSVGAILAAVLSVPNVTSAQVVENNTGASGLVDGINFTLNNGIYVCVAGSASDADIAAALYAAHQGGCPWDYGVSGQGSPIDYPLGIPTTDPYSLRPSYVKANRPNMFDCYVHITAKQGTSAASETAVQNAVLNYAAGNIAGEVGFGVGEDVSSYSISSAVIATLPGIGVSECSVAVLSAGTTAPIWPTGFVSYFAMSPYQQAQISVGNIQVSLS